MKVSVCRLEFHRYKISDLDTFTNEVKNGIFKNQNVFPTPPVSSEELNTIQENFSEAAAEYTQYGMVKKVAFQEARETLINALDQLAAYVDKTAAGNISTITLSGFVPTSDILQPAEPLDIISGFDLTVSKVSGQIIVDIPAYSGQKSVTYSCICVEGAPLKNPELVNGQLLLHADDPTIRQDCNKSRRKVFSGLKPGVQYYFYAFATNSVGVSPLSSAKSIWAS